MREKRQRADLASGERWRCLRASRESAAISEAFLAGTLAADAPGMSESTDEKTQAAEGKGSGSGNKLLIIIALANFLGIFAVGGYVAYDKLYAGHAAAQADKKGEHGADKAEGHGDSKAEGHGEEKAEGDHGEKAEGGHGEKKAEGGHGGENDEHLNPPDGPGPILALEPIVTNLGEPDTDRYLKVTVQLRITSEAARAEVEASLVPIRSQILMYFSSLNVADLSGAEKRRGLQGQVRRIANEAMPSSRVRFVYFTELVIQ
jgi:flagellar basal body-associated protein FliL